MTLQLYTSNQLIDRVRKKAAFTDSQVLGGRDEDILKHLNEAMMTEVIPRLMKVKEEYFVLTRRIPLTAAEHRYRIPKRAIGQKLRDLFFVDSSGEREYLPKINREDVDGYSSTATTSAEAYYPEGNHIVLVPPLSGASGFLEMSYFFRPGELVLQGEVGKITGISGGNAFTLDTIPIAFTAGLAYDIHSPFSGAEVRAFDITPTALGGGAITFTATQIDGSEYGADPVAIGDYVCLAGEAVIPGIPLEMHPILVQAAVCRAIEASGDFEGHTYHQAVLDRMLQAAGYIYENRVEGRPQKVLNRANWQLFGGSGGRSSNWW